MTFVLGEKLGNDFHPDTEKPYSINIRKFYHYNTENLWEKPDAYDDTEKQVG